MKTYKKQEHTKGQPIQYKASDRERAIVKIGMYRYSILVG